MFKNLFEVEKVEFDDKDMQEAYYRGMRDGEANNEISNALIMAGTGIMTAIAYLFLNRRNTRMNRELNAAIAEEGKLGESLFLKEQNDKLREMFGED
jgi:hypothetical protein